MQQTRLEAPAFGHGSQARGLTKATKWVLTGHGEERAVEPVEPCKEARPLIPPTSEREPSCVLMPAFHEKEKAYNRLL